MEGAGEWSDSDGDGEMGLQWSAMTNEEKKRRKEKEGNKECQDVDGRTQVVVGGREETKKVFFRGQSANWDRTKKTNELHTTQQHRGMN